MHEPQNSRQRDAPVLTGALGCVATRPTLLAPPWGTCAPSLGGGSSVGCAGSSQGKLALVRATYLPGWWATATGSCSHNPAGVAVVRYRYRGTKISTPWQTTEFLRSLVTRPRRALSVKLD